MHGVVQPEGEAVTRRWLHLSAGRLDTLDARRGNVDRRALAMAVPLRLGTPLPGTPHLARGYPLALHLLVYSTRFRCHLLARECPSALYLLVLRMFVVSIGN